MKIIIAGSRWLTDAATVCDAVRASGWVDQMTELVHGGCRGVDQIAHRIFN